jgi:hypothetical protein
MANLDAAYFNEKSWEERVNDWSRRASNAAYWEANCKDLARRVRDRAALVINIGAHALLRLLRGEQYMNAYMRAQNAANSPNVVGSPAPPTVDAERQRVDAAFGLANPNEIFFAAISLEGTGVRYYGEYCMVLGISPPDSMQIVDRDSYEILFEPLKSDPGVAVPFICGTWHADRAHMAVLKAYPVLDRPERIRTAGVMAQAVLEGEEYIEAHLRYPAHGPPRGFGIQELSEVRQDARDIAEAQRIESVWNLGSAPKLEELLFMFRRKGVDQQLSRNAMKSRVVREIRQ